MSEYIFENLYMRFNTHNTDDNDTALPLITFNIKTQKEPLSAPPENAHVESSITHPSNTLVPQSIASPKKTAPTVLTPVRMMPKDTENINSLYSEIFDLWLLLAKKKLTSDPTELSELSVKIDSSLKEINKLCSLLIDNENFSEIVSETNLLKIAIFANDSALIDKIISIKDIGSIIDLNSPNTTPFEYGLLKTYSVQPIQWDASDIKKKNDADLKELILYQLISDIKPSSKSKYAPTDDQVKRFRETQTLLEQTISSSISKINTSSFTVDSKLKDYQAFWGKVAKIASIISTLLKTTSPIFELVSISLKESISLASSISSQSQTVVTSLSVIQDILPYVTTNQSFTQSNFLKKQLEYIDINEEFIPIPEKDRSSEIHLFNLKSVFKKEHNLLLSQLSGFIEKQLARLNNSPNKNPLTISKIKKLSKILEDLKTFNLQGADLGSNLHRIESLDKNISSILNLSRTDHNQLTLLLLRFSEYLGFSKTTGMSDYKKFKDENKLMFSSLEHGLSALKTSIKNKKK